MFIGALAPLDDDQMIADRIELIRVHADRVGFRLDLGTELFVEDAIAQALAGADFVRPGRFPEDQIPAFYPDCSHVRWLLILRWHLFATQRSFAKVP